VQERELLSNKESRLIETAVILHSSAGLTLIYIDFRRKTMNLKMVACSSFWDTIILITFSNELAFKTKRSSNHQVV
jgi:hypothetical protein